MQQPTPEPPAPKQYTLTVTAGEGGTVSTEGGTYDEGTEVTITATPAEGYEFIGWEGSDSIENSVMIVIGSDLEISAIFRKLIIESIIVENHIESLIVSHKFIPEVYANYTNGNKVDITTDVKITSIENKVSIIDNNILIGGVKGYDELIFEFEGISTNLTLYVDNIEFEELDSKFLEIKESTIKVPYLMINIFPTNDGIIHNDTIGPASYWSITNPSLEESKSKIKNILLTTKNAIELGTEFRDYGMGTIKPYIALMPKAYINIYVDETNYLDILFQYNNNIKTYDYGKIFELLGIKDYVENEGVKEIWITEFGHDSYPSLVNAGIYNPDFFKVLPESNMSSPLTKDVSNSWQIQDDLPIYNKTYLVYGNSGHRGVDTNIHNRGHQIERQLRYIERDKKSGQELFWNDFVGVVDGNQSLNKRAGNTHFPPNASSDYDYCNQNSIESDIFNWTPQGGVKQIVNCNSWRDLPLNFTYNKYSDEGIQNINNDPHTKWLITWFQSIPGENNNIPYNKNGQDYVLTNWWDIFYNWDDAIRENKNLWE